MAGLPSLQYVFRAAKVRFSENFAFFGKTSTRRGFQGWIAAPAWIFSTLRGFIEAVGGKLEIVARFPGQAVRIRLTGEGYSINGGGTHD